MIMATSTQVPWMASLLEGHAQDQADGHEREKECATRTVMPNIRPSGNDQVRGSRISDHSPIQ